MDVIDSWIQCYQNYPYQQSSNSKYVDLCSAFDSLSSAGVLVRPVFICWFDKYSRLFFFLRKHIKSKEKRNKRITYISTILDIHLVDDWNIYFFEELVLSQKCPNVCYYLFVIIISVDVIFLFDLIFPDDLREEKWNAKC